MKGRTSRRRIRQERANNRTAVKSSIQQGVNSLQTGLEDSETGHKSYNIQEQTHVSAPFNIPEGPCNDYCCSAFALFQDDVITSLLTLSNPIHPVFRESNIDPEIELFRKRNVDSKIDYKLLEPCLQLATRLLGSTSLVPYINIIFGGEIRDIDDGTVFESRHDIPPYSKRRLSVWPKTVQPDFSREAKCQARMTLQRMAEMVSFDVQFLAFGTMAQCTRIHGVLPDYLLQTFPHGCRSQITISWFYYRQLDEISRKFGGTSDATSCGDWTELLHVQFRIARLFCHEFGHALQNAAFGRILGPHHEIFYKDNKLREAGFDLEAELFGGIFSEFVGTSCNMYRFACETGRRQRPQQRMLQLLEWPSYSLMKIYCLRGDDDNISSGKAFASYDMQWTVPKTYLRDLFTDKYWAQTHRLDTSDALHPPRIASWSFKFSEQIHIPLPIPLNEVEDYYGIKRACRLCCSALAPHSHQPEPLIEDREDALSDVCIGWFNDPCLSEPSLREKFADKATEP